MLKNTLYQQRVEWTKSGYQPVCAICGKPSTNGALQMHESLITRGDVSGNKFLMEKIMVSSNCVLVDPACHEFANSEENKVACVVNILKYNRYDDVIAWLLEMNGYMKNGIPLDAISLVKEVKNGL